MHSGRLTKTEVLYWYRKCFHCHTMKKMTLKLLHERSQENEMLQKTHKYTTYPSLRSVQHIVSQLFTKMFRASLESCVWGCHAGRPCQGKFPTSDMTQKVATECKMNSDKRLPTFNQIATGRSNFCQFTLRYREHLLSVSFNGPSYQLC